MTLAFLRFGGDELGDSRGFWDIDDPDERVVGLFYLGFVVLEEVFNCFLTLLCVFCERKSCAQQYSFKHKNLN
jgi:hypothetical protein